MLHRLRPGTWFGWLVAGLKLETLPGPGRTNLAVVLIMAIVSVIFAGMGNCNADFVATTEPKFSAQLGLGTAPIWHYFVFLAAIRITFIISMIVVSLAKKWDAL